MLHIGADIVPLFRHFLLFEIDFVRDFVLVCHCVNTFLSLEIIIDRTVCLRIAAHLCT